MKMMMMMIIDNCKTTKSLYYLIIRYSSIETDSIEIEFVVQTDNNQWSK